MSQSVATEGSRRGVFKPIQSERIREYEDSIE